MVCVGKPDKDFAASREQLKKAAAVLGGRALLFVARPGSDKGTSSHILCCGTGS